MPVRDDYVDNEDDWAAEDANAFGEAINDLEGGLGGKAAATHEHVVDDIDGLTSILDSLSEGRVTGYSNGTANALNFDEMNETQWGSTTPVSGRIYLVFED